MTNTVVPSSLFALAIARDMGLTITDMAAFLSVVEVSRVDSSECVFDAIRSTLEAIAEGEIGSSSVAS